MNRCFRKITSLYSSILSKSYRLASWAFRSSVHEHGPSSCYTFSGIRPYCSQSRRSENMYKFRLVLYMGGSITLLLHTLREKQNRTSFILKASCQSDGNSSCEIKQQMFSRKVVLITGAAGDIGGATAKRFAREKATVILSDLPLMEKSLVASCAELMKLGAPNVYVITADVTSEKDVIKMVTAAKEKAGHIDIFFNNAGVQGELRPIHEQQDKEFKRVTNVNIYGVFLCLKYVSRVMIEQGTGGVIVNSASVAGVLGPANMAAYAASKFAIVGMTKTAAKDLAHYGIRVNAIAPGILEGRLWTTQIKGNVQCRKHLQGDDSEITQQDIREQEERMINSTPLKRLGKLSEVASVVAFLSSDDASYLSGVVLPIDGGRIQ